MPKQRKRDGVYWRKDRRSYWISFVDARGNRQRKPGAANWVEAQQVLRENLTRVKEEVNRKPGEVPPCRDSFADVADRFLAYQKPRLTPKAYQREEGIAKHLKAFFVLNLADVTSSEVSDYITARLGKVSKSSVRKELNTLKHLFRLACGEWKLLSRNANPCLDVTCPKVRDERTQHLTPDQFPESIGSLSREDEAYLRSLDCYRDAAIGTSELPVEMRGRKPHSSAHVQERRAQGSTS